MCHLEAIGTPSIFKLIRKAAAFARRKSTQKTHMRVQTSWEGERRKNPEGCYVNMFEMDNSDKRNGRG